MTIQRGEATVPLEVKVRASQLMIEGDRYTVFGVRDISDEKRRAALERIFLHDISNTLTPLLTWSQLLAARASGQTSEFALRVANLARRMCRDIEGHRSLLLAERGTLKTKQTSVCPNAACESAIQILEGCSERHDRVLQFEPNPSLRPIVTDESLLVRILVNMLKNAFEATATGGTIKLWIEDLQDRYEFRVWNARAIPPLVAAQIFKRSFSTKPERGHGLGTFSIRLFAERYLGGKVGFTSNEESGTTFFLQLPRSATLRLEDNISKG